MQKERQLKRKMIKFKTFSSASCLFESETVDTSDSVSVCHKHYLVLTQWALHCLIVLLLLCWLSLRSFFFFFSRSFASWCKWSRWSPKLFFQAAEIWPGTSMGKFKVFSFSSLIHYFRQWHTGTIKITNNCWKITTVWWFRVELPERQKHTHKKVIGNLIFKVCLNW